MSSRAKAAVGEVLEVLDRLDPAERPRVVIAVNMCGRVMEYIPSCGEISTLFPVPEGLYIQLEEIRDVGDKVMLRFRRLRLIHVHTIVEEGYYWEETRIQHIYRVEPTEEAVDVYAVRAQGGRLVPLDASQLEQAIANVIDMEYCSKLVTL